MYDTLDFTFSGTILDNKSYGFISPLPIWKNKSNSSSISLNSQHLIDKLSNSLIES